MSRTVQVTATHCTDMPLAQAAAYIGRADDWPDDVTLQSVVQVIEFIRRDGPP